MQAQTQISVAVPGQVSRMDQQNGGSSIPMQSTGTGSSSWRRTWQTDADVPLRRKVVHSILELFQKRQGPVTQEWQQKLPDFVKRLEEALYHNAFTKDEYTDPQTLESRLQLVAKRISRANHNAPQHGGQIVSSTVGNMMPIPGNNMIPTPGNVSGPSVVGLMMPGPATPGTMVPTPGTVSNFLNPGGMMNMIPTPGHGNSMMPNMLSSSGKGMMMTPGSATGSMFNNAGNLIPSSAGVVKPVVAPQVMGGTRMSQNGNVGSSSVAQTVGSQMIPTPGLTSTQGMGFNQGSSSGLIPTNVTATALPHLQPFGGVQRHMYPKLNGQINSTLSNIGLQRKEALASANGMSSGGLIGNNQHLMDGNAMMHKGGYMTTSQLSNMPMPSLQQRHNQQGNQQRPQAMRMQTSIANPMGPTSEGYAMNAADLAGGGMSYPSVASDGLIPKSLGINTDGSQPSRMIPVPGLRHPVQNSSHLQQTNPTQILESNTFSQNSSVSRNQLQQHIQISKSHGLYQSTVPPSLSALNLPTGSLPQDQLQQPSPTQKIQLPPGRPFLDSQQQSPQLQSMQAVSLQVQQMNMQSRQSQPSPGMLQQLNDVTHQQQGQQQVSQVQQKLHEEQLLEEASCTTQLQPPKSVPQIQQSVQHSRMQHQVQQGSFSHSQQSHRQMPSVPQVHDLHQEEQFQSIVSPSSCPEQESQPATLLVSSTPCSSTSSNARVLGGQIPAGSIDPQRAQQYSKQQRWLLFLRHASKCSALEGQCNISPHCHMARQLWAHLSTCREQDCPYTRCNASRTLLQHYRQCTDVRCPVCGPVKQMITQKRPQATPSSFGQTTPAAISSVGFGINSSPSGSVYTMMSDVSAPDVTDVGVQPPPAKRVKTEPGNMVGTPGLQPQYPLGTAKFQISPPTAAKEQATNPPLPLKAELHTPGNTEGSKPILSTGQDQEMFVAQRHIQAKVEVTQVKLEQGGFPEQTLNSVKAEQGSGGVGMKPVKQESLNSVVDSNIPTSGAKSGKPKIVGTSMTELFTPEMIREHITGLRQWVGQSKAKAEKNQAMEHQMSDNACRLCAVEKLTFEPPPIYCSACGARIKRNALYYTVGLGEGRHFFCIPCYNDIRTDSVDMDGMTYPKSRLEKRKNDEETEEAWVQCDKCNQWNHQVCALFNGRRNEGGEAEYTCPQCCMSEIEGGERKPLLSSAVLGAKDLPKTFLSDHLEQRLARKLKQERTDRARAMGKSFEEIPGADSLVVRVVSSVDKKLEVKQHFMEIFQEEDYPSEFPYKSKVVLLFQKIEGVEVCLFGMYVQEFGVECQHPNQRRVYLSYLDSVKYFRPDVKTVNGEALRTYVYHEILIAYLDYCKRRGFSSCYIWACPPLKGEDYILYCHPEIQKTPKSDKLRDWYLTMLKKATADGIVVEVTNLYDYFFVSTGECKAKVTAARLPYFDGDYWPGAAEDMIVQLQQEEEDGRKVQKKGKNKKTATKRSSKLAVQAELASNASKDLQLMHKLGESILPMKEDFIMVHMHHACTYCRLFIVTGYRWTCKQCKNVQLCDSCHDADQDLDERDRHPASSKDVHALTPIQVEDIPQETKDKDEFMESEFFDTRQAFLSLCQGNHYQYDTLRRAKHSSMMVLYHLHNPTAPAFVITCNMCHRDIETGAGWRCDTCPDFDLCNGCKDSSKHSHKLTPHPSPSERNEQNKEARQQRVIQLRKMLELLVHASQCGVPQCNYPKCRSVKGLFRHGMMCKIRASGGCALCKRMWYLLQLHARACKESECRVPRCKDLKEHLRRSIQQQESRRRAAVMEMMRQRAAEAAGG